MPVPATERGLTFLLASQAQQKIDGNIGGVQVAIPLPPERVSRQFLVIRDSKLIPGKVSIQRWQEQGRQLNLIGNEPTEEDPQELPLQYPVAPSGDVLIVERDLPEFDFPKQPVVEDAVRRLDQGFLGASKRIGLVKRLNRTSSHPVDYDYVVAVENAQVVYRDEDVDGRPVEVTEDAGFVVVEDRWGNRRRAHSTGIAFGDNQGVDYFEQSEASGFSVPAGHIYSPDNLRIPTLQQPGAYTIALPY